MDLTKLVHTSKVNRRQGCGQRCGQSLREAEVSKGRSVGRGYGRQKAEKAAMCQKLLLSCLLPMLASFCCKLSGSDC